MIVLIRVHNQKGNNFYRKFQKDNSLIMKTKGQQFLTSCIDFLKRSSNSNEPCKVLPLSLTRLNHQWALQAVIFLKNILVLFFVC